MTIARESSTSSRLSVLLITFNEERMIERVLESVKWADEIVIVDSGSTDGTESIARRYTDQFHTLPFEGHGAQRRRSLDLSSGEWIFFVDADEVVTPALAASIRKAIDDPGEATGFRIRLDTWFLGQWFGRRGWRREWRVRLFRRDAGRFDEAPVHEGAIVAGKIDTLDGVLLHYPYRDLHHFAEKMNRYSTAMAAERRRSGCGGPAAGAVLRGGIRFLRDYIAGGDFLYGGAGLIRSAMFGYYTFQKYAKVWEDGRPRHPGERSGDTSSPPASAAAEVASGRHVLPRIAGGLDV